MCVCVCERERERERERLRKREGKGEKREWGWWDRKGGREWRGGGGEYWKRERVSIDLNRQALLESTRFLPLQI